MLDNIFLLKSKKLLSTHTYILTAKFSEDAYFPNEIPNPFGKQQSKIKDGTKTDYLPFQVLLNTYKNGKYYRCGGALISNHLVLTAYHCLRNITDLNSFYLKSRVVSGVLIPYISGPHEQV